MIRPRGQFPVNEKACVIIPSITGLTFCLMANGFEFTDRDPRWLSNSALDSGAKHVDWDFDLTTVKEFV